ncbi:nuclear transport factor 2 family protein [Glycomyces buryatensis]|uniref:Nuclear transport factor 2 family protein n=1 Tax=Glycomyces buryatensis TaxID=2570927 RepID=A0A4S8QEF6_9ACTN|nr:nuclear transport factor 2 family protein [Glycomyces buryatensis]THV43007.1 nuclear transport factor 2 family protein [Glycomyces buryatensis]
MTATSTALDTALAYHKEWTEGDFDKAMTYLADDVVCETPLGRFEGVQAFRAFLEPFAQRLIGSTLLAGFGDDETALIMYVTKTPLVPNGPAAEYMSIQDRKITHARLVFDQLPGVEARKAAGIE